MKGLWVYVTPGYSFSRFTICCDFFFSLSCHTHNLFMHFDRDTIFKLKTFKQKHKKALKRISEPTVVSFMESDDLHKTPACVRSFTQ